MSDAAARHPPRCARLCESIEIDAPIDRVFSRWLRCEDFPRFMSSVRHVRRIDERSVLWDVDILARQIVWVARVVDVVAPTLIRWDGRSGVRNRGEVRCEETPEGRTRLTVEIAYQPRSALERLLARLGVVDRTVRHELESFRRLVETLPRDEPIPLRVGASPS